MISVNTDWNPKQARLKEIILKKENITEAIQLCLDMHSLVHTSGMSGICCETYEDILWNGMSDDISRIMPAKRDVTIAWNIWHITRIEDITANILIADDKQVMNSDDWLFKMNIDVRDTGNAMTNDEIVSFSSKINMDELRNYRVAVGRKTREIISQLKQGDMKRKMEPSRLKRVIDEGGVLEHKDSVWLLDFWGKKNVAGILLMPVTRHQVVHLNDSLKIKQKYSKRL